MNKNIDVALLLIRIGLAAVFIVHGYDKVTNMSDTLQFFELLKLPAFVAYLIAYIELLGGVAMLLGVFTGWAGILLAGTMVGAIVLVKMSKGFLGGYEFDLVLFLSAIAIALAGPGEYVFKKVLRKG